MTLPITKETVADLIVTLYQKQAEKYGGETTLNELRVIASCYRAFTYSHNASISSIATEQDMPSSTVHRAVTNLIAKGWVADSPDPQDGRKRIIELSEKAVAGGLWEFVANFIENHPSRRQD